MRRLAWLVCSVALIGCAPSDEQPDAALADSVTVAPPPAGLSLADVTGTWNVSVMGESSDSVLLTYVLNATPDTATWTIKFPDQAKPVPVHVVSMAGDSMMVHAGPYSSPLRKGVMVTTDGVSRLENGMLVGRTTAHYSTGQDSVRMFRTMGMRGQ